MPGPPNAQPVARFLLFERAYPDSVAASVDALLRSIERADLNPRNSEPVLRLTRLGADLEFRRRAADDGAQDGDLHSAFARIQAELALVDVDIAERYFAGACRPGSRHNMNFAIRYLTEYRYDGPVTDNLNALRVRPATTSTQRCDEFHVPHGPRDAGAPPRRLLRHRGDRVRDPQGRTTT